MMMHSPEAKVSGRKLVLHSDVRARTVSGECIRPENSLRNITIGTWNVRTLRQVGKLENLKIEMDKNNVCIMGVSEVRWKEQGDFESGDYHMYYSGSESAERGVAIVMQKWIKPSIIKVEACSDRLMYIKLNAEPVDIVIIQVYMPTSDHEDEEVEIIYEKIEEIISTEGRGKVQTIIMGDWNSVVGKGAENNIVGPHGLGTRNRRGDMMVDFCQRNGLVITNTWFKKHHRRLYTWKSPGDRSRYQIDYILVKQRFRNSIKDVTTVPSADIDSDHNLLTANVSTRMKKIRRRGMRKKRWNLENLKNTRDKVRAELEIKLSESVGESVEEEWTNVKKCLTEILEEKIGRMKRIPRKPWISQAMLDKMEERRRWKNINSEEGRQKYRKLNNELRRETDKAREDYISGVCDDIMELQRIGRYDMMYAKVKELGWKEHHGIRTRETEDKTGNIVRGEKEVQAVWENYIEELYDKANRPDEMGLEPEEDIEEDDKGPGILQSEVEKAIRDMRRRKATGDDDIPSDLLKELGEKGVKALTRLINKIYVTGEWPKDFLEVTMIPLQKKKNAKKCSDYRTISLISHAAKIMTRILTKRIEKKIEEVLGDDQFGFRRGKGTRDAIGVLRIISERVFDVKEEVCACFIDWKKAFDRVNWEKLMMILKTIGIDWRDRRLIGNLYMQQKVKVRLDSGDTKSVEIGRGVRQGCCLSPILFNLYGEWLAKEALDGTGDFKIGGRVITTIKYADDLVVLAKEEKELQNMMDKLVERGREYGMKINIEKSKVMRISPRAGPLNITVENQQLEKVEHFKYLGSIITADALCTKEVKVRIAMAKAAFIKQRLLLTSKLDLEMKKKLVKCCIWSVALYGAETWTLRKKEQKYLESFEMWCWRRIEMIKWTDRVTNEEVLRRVNEQRHILKTIIRRKANWMGHIMRRNGLISDIIEGQVEGKRGLGRRRIQLTDDLKQGRKMKFQELKREAANRTNWRTLFGQNNGPVVRQNT